MLKFLKVTRSPESTENTESTDQDDSQRHKKRLKQLDTNTETTELITIDNVEQLTMSRDWLDAFSKVLNSKLFKQMKERIAEEIRKGATVYPDLASMYSFTRCPLRKIKVVIIGQDPYHGPDQAHGICFSVQRGIAIPASLVNIYQELSTDIPGFKRPSHGCLEDWVSQGVLLLNATLTVRKGEPNSHSKYGWDSFTDAIIQHLNKNSSNLVFMLWGRFAQKKGKDIDARKHLVLKATHPSPLGANKGGWFGCKHFSQANAYLKNNGKGAIDWQIL